MKTIQTLLNEAMRVENLLEFPDRYLAHLPRVLDGRPVQKLPETLGEHMALVLQQVNSICEINGLFGIIEKLADEVVAELDFRHPSLVTEPIRELFVNAIVFHDFGKVNEHFQIDRMNNSNPVFQRKYPQIFSPKHGHSELGTFIFLVYHLEKFNLLDIPEKDETDKTKLSTLVFLFSNTILLHHHPNLSSPFQKLKNNQFTEKLEKIERYVQLYKSFPGIDISKVYLEELRYIFEEFQGSPTRFALFALLRLNYSLLTTADYIATGQYSYDLAPEGEKDWGVLSEAQRSRIIQAAEQEKSFNREAYLHFRRGNYEFQHPLAQSEDNLNLLRREMSVNVLQQLEANGDKRLFYLEAPTGGGKTNLSMLAVAELLRRNKTLKKVFYVFPFTTLITQTHKSIRETLNLDEAEIALLHGKVGFQTTQENSGGKTEEEKEDGTYGSKRRDFVQNLFALYPVLLLTNIRFFDILKSNDKEDIYLLHRLANSIVVLDELQSYNPRQWDKMMYLLDQYSRYFNICFILMSATLPRLDKIKAVRASAKSAATSMPEIVDLLPNPRQYFINPNFKGRVSFNFEFMQEASETSETELAAVVLQKSRERAQRETSQGRVFTIVEFIFKKTATSFKAEIEKLEPFFDHLFVLSGTILESRRREIISFLKRNKKAANLKVLLITTQVVEAGVDIDMDLGFKNVSLIDSDEQLAGRVNRNVGKRDCEVYLFKLNEPNVLYSTDLRYKATRELPASFHKDILESKDFMALYERVFEEIDKRNESLIFENFSDYLKCFEKLDFPDIHSKFKLIEQSTLSIFVPICLPVLIENEEGQQEPFFTSFELGMLKRYHVFAAGNTHVDGSLVWELYRRIMENPQDDFIARKIERKAIQGILSKFTFSIFDSEKMRSCLAEYINPELSFEKYLLLSDHSKIYDTETGLRESGFNDPANSII